MGSFVHIVICLRELSGNLDQNMAFRERFSPDISFVNAMEHGDYFTGELLWQELRGENGIGLDEKMICYEVMRITFDDYL